MTEPATETMAPATLRPPRPQPRPKPKKHQPKFKNKPVIPLHNQLRTYTQIRLFNKLQDAFHEYISTAADQEAVVLIFRPQSALPTLFGTEQLRGLVQARAAELRGALAARAPPPAADGRFELPPLLSRGEPASIHHLPQHHLRSLIPIMLKYSTGRVKPGWGRRECRPAWWPADAPWANVRVDRRAPEAKRAESWTHVLRKVVISCYTYHGREDLLLLDGAGGEGESLGASEEEVETYELVEEFEQFEAAEGGAELEEEAEAYLHDAVYYTVVSGENNNWCLVPIEPV